MRKTATPTALPILLLWLYLVTTLFAEPGMMPAVERTVPFGMTNTLGQKMSSQGPAVTGLLIIPPENPPTRNLPTRSPQTSLHYAARGTGRTTGHIATLYVSNPTPMPLRTVVGDMFIPSDQDYQGYVVLQTYPVEVKPFSTVLVPLEGYCTNVQRPPVPDGGAMPAVSQWVSWAEADPLPEPGKAPAPAFFIAPEAAPGDPLALTYPGTTTPFPYRIDFNRNPLQAARLLLHAAWAAGQAFDQYVREGKIRLPETRRHDVIQQSLWAYAARLEGKTYDKTAFATQLTEEAEQQLNRPAAAFSEETQQQVDREMQDIWAGISLVGAGAKLIPPAAQHPTDIFQEIPSGPAVHPADALSRILDNTDPAQPDAPDKLVPALVFLQKNDTTPALQTLRLAAREKWKTWLNRIAVQIGADSDTTLRDIFAVLGYLQSAPGGALPEDERRTLTATLLGKLTGHLQTRADALRPDDPAYLRQWRTLKSWQSTRWYTDYCAAANPLKTLGLPQPARSAAAFNPANIAFAGASWKHTFLPVPGAGPKKFPWWIPAVAAGGGVVYLLLQDKADTPPAPTPPVAVADAVTLPCGGQTVVNVLANDTGEGISVTSATGTSGVSVSVSGTTEVLVVSGGFPGAFTAAYTIADKAGQTATGSIVVTVTDQTAPVIVCPANLSLEGCGQPPAPAVSGQATATDDCGPAPAVGFADELSGTPCNRLVTRTWSAVDASGKNAVCTQTITILDQTAPVFTFCPPAVTVSLGQQNNLGISGQAEATDACLPPVVEPTFADDLSGFSACGGVIARTWMATDACGSTVTCAQMITVPDTAPPVITCPGAVTVDCGRQTDLAVTGQATATDNCPGPVTPVFADNPPALTDCSGTIARTWTATDGGGNTASCTQIITVLDQTAPVFTLCPPAVTVSLGQQNDLGITGQAAATDACLPPVVEPTFADDLSGFGACGGVIARIWTATDACVNTATCAQTITVQDQKPPEIMCPGPVETECGKQTDLTVTGQATAVDDCAGPLTPTYADTPPVFSGCSGPIIRTWTAADPGGNTATCVQDITVVDKSGPVFTTCPHAVTVPCGQQNNLDITGKAVAQDACNGATPPAHTDNTSGFSGCSGVIVRRFSSADSCGNSAICQQTITVFDDMQPVFTTCPQAVFVNCGQQNNLNITGQAVAVDACSGPAVVTHTDDLSEFLACEGLIWRTFLATDLCGNTATCLQPITVVNAPCGFTPLFAFSPAVCGDCNGAVSTTMSPPGSYTFEWETGDAGPNVTGLCPGPISVTITDNVNECTDIFTPEVPDMPMLILTVLQTIPPSGPSANDGRVVLQVGPPSAQLPFLVFVNGAPVGTANTYTFQITNMPAGEYEIFVVDEGGEGCPSNTVFVVLLPQEPPPAGPEAGFVSPWFLPGWPAMPEQPGSVPAAAHVVWGAPVGISAGLPLGNLWQLRMEVANMTGRLYRSGAGVSEVISVRADRLTAGVRRYFPQQSSRWVFFQENSVSHTVLQANMPVPIPSRWQWRLNAGGGLRFSLENTLRIDLSGSLGLDFAPGALRLLPAFQVQAQLNLNGKKAELRMR